MILTVDEIKKTCRYAPKHKRGSLGPSLAGFPILLDLKTEYLKYIIPAPFITCKLCTYVFLRVCTQITFLIYHLTSARDFPEKVFYVHLLETRRLILSGDPFFPSSSFWLDTPMLAD